MIIIILILNKILQAKMLKEIKLKYPKRKRTL